MSATLIDIPDAVVALLNGATFSQSFTAERAYVAPFDLEDLHTLKVKVIAGTLDVTAWDLKPRNSWELEVGIYVQRRVVPDVAAVDPLTILVDEIIEVIGTRPLPGTRARQIGFSVTPPFDPTRADTHHLFHAVITPKYRLTRD